MRKVTAVLCLAAAFLVQGCAAHKTTLVEVRSEIAYSPTALPRLDRGETIAVVAEKGWECNRPHVAEEVARSAESGFFGKGYRSAKDARYIVTINLVACVFMNKDDAVKNVDAGYGGDVSRSYQGPHHVLDTAIAIFALAAKGPAEKKDWVYQTIVADVKVQDTRSGTDSTTRFVNRHDGKASESNLLSLVASTGRKIAELLL